VFENLQKRLTAVLAKVRGQLRLSEKNIQDALGEVRLALLEADVNYRVTREFIRRVRERAIGADVLKGLTPDQHFIKIVHEELIQLLGGQTHPFDFSGERRAVYMLCGLQGSGKTTTAGKFALFLRKRGRHPLLVAADVYRPAAIQQLKVVGEQVETPVYAPGADVDPVKICRDALRHAEKEGLDSVILDTAGRLHIDQDMMGELIRVKEALDPQHILLVVDSMVGQDAVNQAKEFNQSLEITGIILTKLDGDARGGAALSIREVTGKPIFFAGVGEKLEDFERFHPDRMASRILGMGDVLSLIEKAQEVFDQEQAQEMQKKLLDQSFTLEDFLNQMQQMKKMGNLQDIMEKMPFFSGGGRLPQDFEMDEREMVVAEAIIRSMTPAERLHPQVIGGSRRKRIAKGSGTSPTDVNRLLKQFDESKRMIRQMVHGPMGRMMGGVAKAVGKMSANSKDKAKLKAKRKKEKKARRKARRR
jgi:signal recognition particle subunit SRP54